MKIKTTNLTQGPVRHTTLSDAFVERVKEFTAVITEVDHTPLDVFLDSFQRDMDPETELAVWEKIAATYQWATVGTPGLAQDQKKDIFTVILGLSMGTKDFNNLQNLSKEMIASLESRFS